MTKLKRIISILCIMITVISLTLPMFTFAEKKRDVYTDLFNTAAAPYMIPCQPSTAICLTDTVSLTPAMKSPNYFGGTVDLPRLSTDYYYSLGDNNNYFFGKTAYPTLCWKSDAIGQSVTLNIKSYTGKNTLVSFTISIDKKFEQDDYRDNSEMAGTDYWYPTSDILSKSDSKIVLVPAREFTDASCNVINGLLLAGNEMRIYEGDDYGVTLYPGELHKNCLIMPTYAITPNADIDSLSGMNYTNKSLSTLSYPFIREDVGSRGISKNINLHNFTENFTSGIRDALLFMGSKFEDCIFDGNTGTCETVTVPEDTTDLYYFIGIGDQYFFACVSTDSTDTDAFTQVDPNSPKMTWEADKWYRLQSSSSHSYDDSDYHNNFGFSERPESWYMHYGPVDFTSFWDANSSYGISLRTGEYAFQHSCEEDSEEFNVFAESLIYAGCIPHIGSLKLKAAEKKATINYYYHTPDNDTGKWELLDSVTYNVDNFNPSSMPEIPALENYERLGWFTNTSLDTEFDESILEGDDKSVTVNLYSGYKYVGGYYDVVFYNDIEATTDKKQYKVTEMPVLPERPASGAGYSFKNWAIVTNQSDTAGVEYSPSTFKPVRDNTYIFKTMWDIKGIIVKVLTTKTSYYVGEDIDKSLLKVYVQDSTNQDKTRVLKDKEYTIDNPTVSKVGTYQFQITYTATGATATCEVTGLPDTISEISAVYKGGKTVLLGTELEKGDFSVKVLYRSKKEEETKAFDFTPKVLDKLGKRTITITHADFKTTIKIKVIRDPNDKVNLTSLSAAYTGGVLKVGSQLKARDLLVTAFYDDNTSRTLKDTEFKYSPKKFTVGGKQSVTITYGGLGTSIVLDIEENKKPEPEPQPTPTPQPEPQPEPEPQPTPTPQPEPQPTPTPPSNNSGTGHNSGSSDNNDNNSSNGSSGNNNNNSSNDNTNSDDSSKSDEKGPSPGYLAAATILTNTINSSLNIPDNKIDINKELDEAEAEGDLNLTLINGANGNELTPSMLEKVKSKKINLNVNMVTPEDQTMSVGLWKFKGADLDNTNLTINPNITFEVTDKKSDKLLYFAVNDLAYPKGTSFTVIPEVKYFPSGDVIRLYSCDMTKNHSKLLKTSTWMEISNQFKIDLDKSKIYCISNAMSAYKDDTSLLVENGLPSKGDSDTDVDDTKETEEDIDTEEQETEEPYDWEEGTKPKKSSGKFLIIIIVLVFCILSVLSVMFLIIFKNRRN